jgi:hypothetical protein
MQQGGVVVPVDTSFDGAVEDLSATSLPEVVPCPFYGGLDLRNRTRSRHTFEEYLGAELAPLPKLPVRCFSFICIERQFCDVTHGDMLKCPESLFSVSSFRPEGQGRASYLKPRFSGTTTTMTGRQWQTNFKVADQPPPVLEGLRASSRSDERIALRSPTETQLPYSPSPGVCRDQ